MTVFKWIANYPLLTFLGCLFILDRRNEPGSKSQNNLNLKRSANHVKYSDNSQHNIMLLVIFMTNATKMQRQT